MIEKEYYITFSFKSIIKTDFKNKNKIFNLTCDSFFTAIDYKDKEEMIVSGSNDKCIKLWNCRNESITINKE